MPTLSGHAAPGVLRRKKPASPALYACHSEWSSRARSVLRRKKLAFPASLAVYPERECATLFLPPPCRATRSALVGMSLWSCNQQLAVSEPRQCAGLRLKSRRRATRSVPLGMASGYALSDLLFLSSPTGRS